MEKNLIQIAHQPDVAVRVSEYAKREDDMKSRVGPTLKGLWNPSRELATVTKLEIFDELMGRFPNFREVITHYKKIAMVSARIGTPFYSTPILLVGDPGLGKTYFASELAKACGLFYDEISLATMTGNFFLTGLASGWATAEPGLIAKIAAKSPIANPIIVADEIDKAGGDSRYSVINPFYTLLEKHSAIAFKDECLRFPIDVSNFNWICTANETDLIPKPILSRLKVFYIEEADEEGMCDIVRSVYAQIIAKEPIGAHVEPELAHEVVVRLAAVSSARDVRKKLYDAVVNAVCDNRRIVELGDLHELEQKQKQRIGFL